MIKILAIGNSFSEDAAAYLHAMAKAGGIEVKVANLYIGGCSLKTHWRNVEENNCIYDYQLNGNDTGIKISIKEALLEETWDFVTLQQASHDSGVEETYYPYLTNLYTYIIKLIPTAKVLIHQTWAYETDSSHDCFPVYDCSQLKMYESLCRAYKNAAMTINTEIIPCGEVIQEIRKLKEFDYCNGGRSLCRDGFHMDLVFGRYAVAAVWYERILNGNILENPYLPGDCKKSEETLIDLIKDTVHKICCLSH